MSNIFIERIMVNPQLGRCNVSFKNGVNVIWARNIEQKEKGADFRNSVGKTTFVQLIDYLLGKRQYITNPLCGEGIFNEKYVLAEVCLGSEYFTIGRRLIDSEENIVHPGYVIDKVLNGEKVDGQFLNYEEYKKFLTKKIYGNNIVIDGEDYVTHRSILSYLIRDQFYGFSKYDSGIKEEKVPQRKKRLDFLLGLITEEKVMLEKKAMLLDKEKKKMQEEKNTLRKYFNYISDETYTDLKKRKYKLQNELKKNQNKLDVALKFKNRIDTEIEENIRKSDSISKQITEKKEELYILRNRLQEYQIAINDIDNEDYKINTLNIAFNIFENIEYEKCPFYMEQLKINNSPCDFLKRQGNGEKLPEAINARKKLLQMERKELIDSIKRVRLCIRQIEREIKSLNNRMDNIQKTLDKFYIQRKEKYEQVEEENKNILHDLELIAKDTRNFEYLEELESRIAEKNGEIKEMKEALEYLQRSRAVELNKYYSKIVKYITNNERMGEINFQTYAPKILYMNGTVDNGAGMKNASILAFDIALLELALNNSEVEACRPQFLVHDSPKLHDLDPAIYNRLMDYTIVMENTYKDKCFQYIITTLDVSETVSKNEKKYVRLCLDNSGDGGKLYGCTINIE